MIDILLATYNSEKFLVEQINSILQQDCSDYRIMIRDGGSTDSTLSIIEKYLQNYPVKFVYLGSYKSNALENFSELLKLSTSDLIMFSDHDDVWVPNKISLSLAKYRELEIRHGNKTPILVFSDSIVVDEKLNVISNSMFHYQHLIPNKTSLNNLLTQNIPYGNTMLFNKSLKEITLPISSQAVMHDHWVTLVASCFGKMSYIDNGLLMYRQHNDNFYGACNYSEFYFIKKIFRGIKTIQKRFYQNVTQAQAFLECYQNKLSPQNLVTVKTFASFDKVNFIKKRYYLFKYRLWKCGLLRNIGMFFVI